MRLLPILTAFLVTIVLYALVFERDRLVQFAGSDAAQAQAVVAPAEQTAATPEDTAPAEVADIDGAVRVIAKRSTASIVDTAVILRGQTEALRAVEVRAETSGKVVSEPLRKGTLVEAGQLLCELDPGTREVSLQEALARLAEAKSRLPETAARLAEAQANVPAARARIAEAEASIPAAEARLAEAQAGIPAAQARLAEAQSRVPEAEARLIEARARVPEAEARLREAESRVPAAQAQLAEAESRVPEAEARLREAEARVREAEINYTAAQQLGRDGFAAQTRVAGTEAAFEASKAQVQSALSGVKAAASGVEAAKNQVQSALAGVQAAMSQVEAARAGIQAAEAQIQNAVAAVETAQSQIEGATAAVQTARSQIESARTSVISTEALLEGANAGITSAESGGENALAGIQSAEAGVAGARKEIERLRIHAPFAGLLETDTAELGALLQTGSPCATVMQLNPLKIVGFVPESDVSRVKLGERAGARLIDERQVVGTVSFVSRSADQVTRTFRVEMEVPNPDLTFRDGQTADIAIATDGVPAHLLPQSALTLDDNGTLGVRTVDADSKALFIAVKLLRDTREGVYLTGLPDQVNVITVGQEYVTDGVPVLPSYEEILQ